MKAEVNGECSRCGNHIDSRHWFCYPCIVYYEAEVDRLQSALEKYGDHHDECYENGGKCICGYYKEVIGDE